jgi:hypothetical protein
MRNPPNMSRVMVSGREVFRDHDLSAEPVFEFETDKGNRYRVVAMDSGRQQTWTVAQLVKSEERHAGTVRHEKPWLIFGSSAHHYFKPGARVPSGAQNDLWNAVQALAT